MRSRNNPLCCKCGNVKKLPIHIKPMSKNTNRNILSKENLEFRELKDVDKSRVGNNNVVFWHLIQFKQHGNAQ